MQTNSYALTSRASDEKNLLQRRDSYRKLLRNTRLRREFKEQFLVKIFSLADPAEVIRVMAQAGWDPANKDDVDIFSVLYKHFNGEDNSAS